MRLSSSQRQFLLQATQRYASKIELAKDYLANRSLSVEEASIFHLGVVDEPLPGHEPYKGRLAIPYITPSGVVDIRFRGIVLADGDAAGLEFGKKISRELGNVNIISMPEGEDVNSVITKQGSEWIDERIRECITVGQ